MLLPGMFLQTLSRNQTKRSTSFKEGMCDAEKSKLTNRQVHGTTLILSVGDALVHQLVVESALSSTGYKVSCIPLSLLSIPHCQAYIVTLS